jgi:single-strand DNA-binding protein
MKMNNCQLMGRITKDLDLKCGANGAYYLGFTIAITRKFNKEGEEKQSDFISCKAFGKTAENITKFFAKGKLIAIEGRIQTGSYDKEGVKVYKTDVMVDGFHFTGEKKDTSEQSGFQYVDGAVNDEDSLPF